MRFRIFFVLALVLLAISFSGCATGRLTHLEDVSSDQGIVVAKFRIISDGVDRTEGSNVVFDPAYTPYPPPNQFILSKSGYVFAKLPIGTNSIRFVDPPELRRRSFSDDELTCKVSGGGVINYIGDITFYWDGKGAIKGPIVLNRKENIVVTVESNTAEAQEVFRQVFSTDRSVTPSLLVGKQ